jgi:hypothetical protein
MHNDADMSAETSDGRWLTYDQLARLRRIDKPSAVKLATRNHWPRRKGNAGQMQVCVPMHWFERSRDRQDRYVDKSADIDADTGLLVGALSALEDAVSALRDQLNAANTRAERAEADRADERLRADRAEMAVATERQRADDLRAQIDVLNAEMVVIRAEADRALAEERLRADRLSEQVDAGHREVDAARAAADTLRSQVEESERARDHATEVADKAVKAAEALQGDLTLVQTALEQAEAELAVAQHDAQAGQQDAAALRQAEAARKGRGRLRRAWDGWRGR